MLEPAAARCQVPGSIQAPVSALLSARLPARRSSRRQQPLFANDSASLSAISRSARQKKIMPFAQKRTALEHQGKEPAAGGGSLPGRPCYALKSIIQYCLL